MVVAKTPEKGAGWGETFDIDLLSEGRGENGERFCILRIRTPAGVRRELFRIDSLKRSNVEILNQRGAHLISPRAQNELVNRIQAFRPTKRPREVATRLGWRGREFVLPEDVVAADKPRVLTALAPEVLTYAGKFRVSAGRDTSIFDLAKGNTRLIVALALSFVGPCAVLGEYEQVGLQFFGAPGSGKSSIGVAAGSMWGCHPDPNRAAQTGFMEVWNNTPNQFDILGYAHNHTMLIADEVRTATGGAKGQSEALRDVIMRLERGTERGRLTNPNPSRSWWTGFLSTSNESIDAIFAQAGIAIDDSYRGRLIDIPAPEGGFGMFEDLHGYDSVAAFSAKLKQLAIRSFGWPGRDFAQELVKRLALGEGVKRLFQSNRLRFLKKVPAGTDPRVAEKFATIFAAGLFAERWRAARWDRVDLANALLSCLEDHNRHVADVQSRPAPKPVDPLITLVDYIGAARTSFVDLSISPAPIPTPWNSAIYIASHRGNDEFLFPPKLFDKIAGSKTAADRLKTQLRSLGLLDTVGAHKTRHATRRTIGNKRQWVLALSQRILEEASVSLQPTKV